MSTTLTANLRVSAVAAYASGQDAGSAKYDLPYQKLMAFVDGAGLGAASLGAQALAQAAAGVQHTQRRRQRQQLLARQVAELHRLPDRLRPLLLVPAQRRGPARRCAAGAGLGDQALVRLAERHAGADVVARAEQRNRHRPRLRHLRGPDHRGGLVGRAAGDGPCLLGTGAAVVLGGGLQLRDHVGRHRRKAAALRIADMGVQGGAHVLEAVRGARAEEHRHLALGERLGGGVQAEHVAQQRDERARVGFTHRGPPGRG